MEIANAPQRMAALPSWLLAQAATASAKVVGEALAGTGASRSRYAALTALAELGPSSQTALSRAIGLDRSDMVRLLDELVEEGLVVREPDPDDRRRNRVLLTRAGRSRLRTWDRIVDEAQTRALGPLSAAERDKLAGLLRKALSV